MFLHLRSPLQLPQLRLRPRFRHRTIATPLPRMASGIVASHMPWRGVRGSRRIPPFSAVRLRRYGIARFLAETEDHGLVRKPAHGTSYIGHDEPR